MKHIVLTGGGTAGHVTPNIALIPRLQELGYQISYIGSYDGIEKKLIEDLNIMVSLPENCAVISTRRTSRILSVCSKALRRRASC